MLKRSASVAFGLLILLTSLLPSGGQGLAVAAPLAADTDGFADANIRAVWRRDDGNVGQTGSWIWGPGPFYTTYEPSNGTPTGTHLVQYFDKGRLEVNDPGADRDSKWFVTSGLLVKEMVLGRIETGVESGDFELRSPATVPVAGESGGGAAPGYDAFAALLAGGSPGDLGDGVISNRLSASGELADASGLVPELRLGHFEATAGHNIAAPFWEFMQGSGPSGRASFDWFYIMGLPVTEPVWVQARIDGASQPVLVQLFERRVLTYTPANEPRWRVEMGNVGRHYYSWRYGDTQSDTKTAGQRTNYDVEATVNANRSVDVIERVRYTNTIKSGKAIEEIVMRAIYRHWSGAFTVRGASEGGGETTTRWRDDANLAVALGAPLQPGATAEFTLRFTITPPRIGGRHGYDAGNDMLNLGDWLPTVVPYENGGWAQYPYARHGDQGIADVSDYRVTFTSPGNIVVAGTGSAEVHEAKHWVISAPGVRDVAYTISPRLLNPYDDSSLRRQAGDVQVLGYFLPAHRAAGAVFLDTVASSIRWYSTRVGAYPHKVFTVSEMARPSEDEWDYSQEYPMLYLIPTQRTTTPQVGTWTWYTPLHEVAHAWFFSTIGNNQLTDPWLDEAMANTLALEYVRANRSDLFASARDSIAGPGNGWPVSAGLYSGFPNDDAYFTAVYDQGTTFVQEVRAAMGADAFWRGTREYYANFSGRRARSHDLLDAWQHNSAADLSPIFNRYLAVW